ncbi:hypothetical protein K432DRAFT_113004 [Lepidopterella palustris CBS 459.81]|uniref:Uncharacterized protein n=1 Tax=Lepidopterella palustris CBS 459.81 TaxID=1314670 RepID=A0A8E2E5J8_9PEZI|nr:hypothetical protein K432DRAFT_113004 [Lepidopterella palustris CBS 459.81]
MSAFGESDPRSNSMYPLSSQSVFRFLELPGEIRNQIYNYTLVLPETIRPMRLKKLHSPWQSQTSASICCEHATKSTSRESGFNTRTTPSWLCAFGVRRCLLWHPPSASQIASVNISPVTCN